MELTARQFIDDLKSYQSDDEFKKIRRYFKEDDPENQVIGVRMKHTFKIAYWNFSKNTHRKLSVQH